MFHLAQIGHTLQLSLFAVAFPCEEAKHTHMQTHNYVNTSFTFIFNQRDTRKEQHKTTPYYCGSSHISSRLCDCV